MPKIKPPDVPCPEFGILFQLKGKITWPKVRKALNATCDAAHAPRVDFRKASKNNTPLKIVLSCKDELSIRKVKQFPLKDKKCKCGKHYFIKYEPYKPSAT